MSSRLSLAVCRYKQHGSIFKSNIIGETTVFIYGEQHIRRLLQGEHKLVSKSCPPTPFCFSERRQRARLFASLARGIQIEGCRVWGPCMAEVPAASIS